jgi:hypothetical protein
MRHMMWFRPVGALLTLVTLPAVAAAPGENLVGSPRRGARAGCREWLPWA